MVEVDFYSKEKTSQHNP